MGTPSLRELNRYVTPQYAVHWKEIGIQLGLSDAKLKIIRADNPNSVEKCCNEMLAQWLQLYSTATWNELFEAINCCTESSGKDDDQIHPSSNNMRESIFSFICVSPFTGLLDWFYFFTWIVRQWLMHNMILIIAVTVHAVYLLHMYLQAGTSIVPSCLSVRSLFS